MPWPLNENPAQVIDIFTSFEPGYRLVDGEDLKVLADVMLSVRDGIVGGTTQQNATPLETSLNYVAGGVSVVLPPGLQGRRLVVINGSAGTIQVYGVSYNPLTGLADGIASSETVLPGTVVSQGTGVACEYQCYANGLWKQLAGNVGSGGGGGGITDAPLNPLVTYGRYMGDWTSVIPMSGNTATLPMTEPLFLSGNPTQANQAVNLGYIMTSLMVDEGTY